MRILVIDEHALLRRGLVLLVREAFPNAEVREATLGRDALSSMEADPVDVALVNVRLSSEGSDVLYDLQAGWPTVPLIVIATYEGWNARGPSADGVAGYLMEDATPNGLAQAIEVALSGGNVLSSRVVRNLFPNRDPWTAQKAGTRRSAPSLTLRETGIIALLAEGRTNRDISRELFLSEKTVKAHLAAIYRKLGLNNRTQAAMVAVSMGIGPMPNAPSPDRRSPERPAVNGDNGGTGRGVGLGPRPVPLLTTPQPGGARARRASPRSTTLDP